MKDIVYQRQENKAILDRLIKSKSFSTVQLPTPTELRSEEWRQEALQRGCL